MYLVECETTASERLMSYRLSLPAWMSPEGEHQYVAVVNRGCFGALEVGEAKCIASIGKHGQHCHHYDEEMMHFEVGIGFFALWQLDVKCRLAACLCVMIGKSGLSEHVCHDVCNRTFYHIYTFPCNSQTRHHRSYWNKRRFVSGYLVTLPSRRQHKRSISNGLVVRRVTKNVTW
jgi:hypothetical protein